MNALRVVSAASLIPRNALRAVCRPTTARRVSRVFRTSKQISGPSARSFTLNLGSSQGRPLTTTPRATAEMAQSPTAASATEFIEQFNTDYARIHEAYENHFWSTKMNLQGNSTDALTKSFNELEQFLGNQTALATTRTLLADDSVTKPQKTILAQFEKTLLCYIVESADAKAVRESAVGKENAMNSSRNKLALTYTESDGAVTDATPTVLRTKIRSSPSESVRKSCWEATRQVGPFLLANGFPEIIAERNRFARTLGFVDFYDMKVTQAEGFSKKTCFEMLDGLETATKPLLDAALTKLEQEKGADSLKPWNLSYALSGELTKLTDPYFPFENAPEVWGRSFSAMGISYKGTTMRLDLCDRVGKYPNGFCHWPVAPHVSQDGTWNPSRANFTSLATPDEIGSGNTALTTLMHEGGHAAHFANIQMGSPLFSQERAPFSVSLAETQSMFLDSLCGDAAWLGRYARDRSNVPVPWELLQRSIVEKHPYSVFQLRGMLAVPYFEKALYEMDEKELTAENIQKVADEIEIKIQGGLGARPLLSVPHITSDESSCYYHGYVFAEMAVHQTREYFLHKYDGVIVDNEKIGPELLESYWKEGSGEPGFLKMVQNLTGKPLSHDAWVGSLGKGVEELLTDEKVEYDKAVEAKQNKNAIDLGMRALFVHGDVTIADSADEPNGYLGACATFKQWVNKEWPKTVKA